MNLQEKVKFYDNLIVTLKNELNSLLEIIAKSRYNGDFGTYKNLILAFKEVLGLYQGLVEDKTDNGTHIYNLDNTFKIDKDFNIELWGEMFAEQIMNGIKNVRKSRKDKLIETKDDSAEFLKAIKG